MKFFKITGLIIAVAVVSAGARLIKQHVEQYSQAHIIKTKKDPNLTSAEQLSFVLCKKRQGSFNKSHINDMYNVLQRFGIDRSILETEKVKAMAQEFVDDGVCDFYASYKSIGDMIPKKGEGESQFNELTGWERSYIKILAEGECRTQTGTLKAQDRESFLIDKLEKITLPENIGQDDAERLIKEKMPAILWLSKEKLRFNDCQWMNG